MKGQKWLVRFVLVGMAFAMLFSLFRIENVGALSTETTGLYLNGFQQNQGNYARAGAFEIFATDRKLLFYDTGDASLVKTWNLPTYGSNANAKTSIVGINNSYIIVAHSYHGGTYDHVIAWLLNVDTLGYGGTPIFNADVPGGVGGSSAYTGTHGQAILNISGTVYFMFGGQYASLSAGYIYELFPTAQWKMTLNSSRYFYGQTIVIPSETESATFYAITRHADNSTLYHIYKIDFFGTESIMDIGQGGTTLDWGNPLSGQSYVYLIGYKYHLIAGNEYYTMMISYTVEADENYAVGLIRWNDTYIASDNRIVFSSSSAVARIRIFCVRYPGIITGDNDLTDGNYNVVYVGNGYTILQQVVTITDFDTVSPVWSDGNPPSSWQGKTHYYSTSNNVGGYQPSTSNVGFELDYANGKAIADLFTAPNPAFGYVYWLSPPAVSQLDYDFTVNLGQAYQYYGELFIGQVLSGNGYYKLYKKTNPSDAYALMGTGVVNNGQLNFTLINQDASSYWEINLTLTDYGTTYTIDHYVLGVTGTIAPTPGSTIGDISQAADYGTQLTVTLLPPLLILLAPALILGYALGTPGFLAGLILSLTIGAITYIIPIWAIAMIVFSGILLLLLGAGGVGTAGGTQPSMVVRWVKGRQQRKERKQFEAKEKEAYGGYTV